jgi:hypothetical protein
MDPVHVIDPTLHRINRKERLQAYPGVEGKMRVVKVAFVFESITRRTVGNEHHH